MLWLQWGAVVVGFVVLLFFASFTGYYFRNRRLAMDMHRRMQQEAVAGHPLEAEGARHGRG